MALGKGGRPMWRVARAYSPDQQGDARGDREKHDGGKTNPAGSGLPLSLRDTHHLAHLFSAREALMLHVAFPIPIFHCCSGRNATMQIVHEKGLL
jgi:hypothetical protein